MSAPPSRPPWWFILLGLVVLGWALYVSGLIMLRAT